MKPVIPFKYEFVYPFEDEVAIVKAKEKNIILGEREVYGLINQTGNELVPPKYIEIINFSERLILVTISFNLSGFID